MSATTAAARRPPGRPRSAARTGRLAPRTRGASHGSSQALTFGYLAWSILPVLIAIAALLQRRAVEQQLQGFSSGGGIGTPISRRCSRTRSCSGRSCRPPAVVRHDDLAVPLGVSFAIGLDRWRGRLATRGELHDARHLRACRRSSSASRCSSSSRTCSRSSGWARSPSSWG